MNATFAVNTEGVCRPIHRRKRWTKRRRAQMVTYAVCGFDRTEIAHRMGITPHAVSCEMSRLGLTVKALRGTDLW